MINKILIYTFINVSFIFIFLKKKKIKYNNKFIEKYIIIDNKQTQTYIDNKQTHDKKIQTCIDIKQTHDKKTQTEIYIDNK
jgi:hypothetical protein